MTDINSVQIGTMRRALADFGFTVDDGDVREQTDLLLAGGDPDNIIAMFIRGWLRDLDLLEESDAAANDE